MQFNTLKPAAGSKFAKRRVGRGPGSGLGKTAGRGHKGQKARAGGYHNIAFEGGQMPIQMRLPKVGFTSRISRVTANVRMSELSKLSAPEVTIESLRAARLITANIKRVKVMLHGEIDQAFTISSSSIRVTAGAKQAIEACGGKVES